MMAATASGMAPSTVYNKKDKLNFINTKQPKKLNIRSSWLIATAWMILLRLAEVVFWMGDHPKMTRKSDNTLSENTVLMGSGGLSK